MYETDGGALIAAFVTTYLVIFGFAFLFGVAVYVVNGFAFMSLYRKVGVKPWIAWVPYYNTWVWLKLGGQPGWLALLPLVGASIVTLVFNAIGMVRTQIAFRRDSAFVVLGIFLPFVWAFMLGARDSVYEPWRITAAGYPPPDVGYGSVVPDYATAPEALPVFPAPPTPPTPPAA
ncbi:hypothetical protein DVJ78_00780 [Humibacter sp. BT305]|nr:hypothetical protein DVJ78_00780 [Humibacter sp. BT305]